MRRPHERRVTWHRFPQPSGSMCAKCVVHTTAVFPSPVRAGRPPSVSVMMRGMSWRSLARPARGFAVGVAGVAVLVAALFPVRDDVTRATPALLLVLPVLAAA